MNNNIELYKKLYDIELADFINLKQYFINEDVNELSLAVMEYLSDFVTDDLELSLMMFEDVCNAMRNVDPSTDNFIFDGVEYTFKDLSKLNVAELIDLESYFSDENILKVCHILFRPIVSENGCIEEYEGTSKYNDVFNKVPFHRVIGGYLKYVEFRNSFKEDYQYLYAEDDDETEEDNRQIKEVTEQDIFAEEFGWYGMVFTASNNNFLEISGHKSVLSAPADEFLNFMNFFKQKCKLDIDKIKGGKNQPQ